MAAQDGLPARKLDLLIGHVVFAPLAGVFFAAFAGFTVARLGPLVGLPWNGPSTATWVATIFGYYAVNLVFFAPIGMLLSLAVSYAAWMRHPWTDHLAAALAVVSLAAFLNAWFFWGGGDATPELGEFVLLVTLAGLAWFAYVLLRSREAWRPEHPVDRASAWRARVATAAVMAAAVSAWQWPLHYRQERAAAVDAHWNGRRAYVCANIIVSAGVATVGEVAWQRLRIFDLPANAARRRHDVMVAEIGPDRFVRHLVADALPLVASNHAVCLVHDGALHLVFTPDGRQEEWRAARWEGGRFTPLAPAESGWARDAVRRFYGALRNAVDGDWVSNGFHTGEVSFDLGGTPVKMRYHAAAGGHYRLSTVPAEQSRTLFITMGRSAEEPLLTIQEKPVFISRAENLSPTSRTAE